MTDEATQTPAPPGEMDLLGHLKELRKRLIYSFAAIGIGAIIAYSMSDLLFAIINAPYYQAFPQNSLIGTGPAEAFVLKLQVAGFAGLVISCPVIFYQLWLFVAPGLYPQERKLVLPFVLTSSFLFASGILFCYWAVFPLAFKFFREQYLSIGITPAIRLSEHLSTSIWSLLAFGVVFELPVFAYFLARAGVIDRNTLISKARYAIVAIFVIAAVLTPPDVLTQFLMAVPLFLLYGISILVVGFAQPKR